MVRIENLANQGDHPVVPKVKAGRARGSPLAQLGLKLIKFVAATLNVQGHANE